MSSLWAPPSPASHRGLYLDLKSLMLCSVELSLPLKSPVQLACWSPRCQPNWKPLARKRGNRYPHLHVRLGPSKGYTFCHYNHVTQSLDYTAGGQDGDHSSHGDDGGKQWPSAKSLFPCSLPSLHHLQSEAHSLQARKSRLTETKAMGLFCLLSVPSLNSCF